MARAKASCTCTTCGVAFEWVKHSLNTSKAAQNYKAWAEENITECFECRTKRLQKEQAEADAKSGLPELTGTEKQIRWAITIRAEFLKSFELIRWLPTASGSAKQQQKRGTILRDWIIENRTSASWWIDNRDFTASYDGVYQMLLAASKDYIAQKSQGEGRA